MNRRHFFELTIGGLVATWAAPVKDGVAAPFPVGATVSSGPATPAAKILSGHGTPCGFVLSNITGEPIAATVLTKNGLVLMEPTVAPMSNFVADLPLLPPDLLPLQLITGLQSINMSVWGLE